MPAAPTAERTTEGDPFEALRPRLVGVAYRMTGSVADAEDLTQEAWLRWQRTDRAAVTSPEAFLVRTVTRLAIDQLRSARHRRETYVGPFLPEPVVTGHAGDPVAAAELADSLTFAFLVLLDELEPADRAVVLLHDVFGYDFDEVAEVVDRSPDACRKAASRSRRRLSEASTRPVRRSAADGRALIGQLLEAVVVGDVDAVMTLVAPDVVHRSDGGPDRHAARRPVVGAERVTRLLVNLAKRVPAGASFEFAEINGLPGLVVRLRERIDSVLVFDFDVEGRLRRSWSQLNPDKLRHLG